MTSFVKAAIAAIPALSFFPSIAQAGPIQADVVTFKQPDGVTPAAGNVVGHATLNRTQSGVRLQINTTGLQPGYAYTVWWIIFNNPAACAPAGCSGADLATPAVLASVMNATGGVAKANGGGKFTAFLPLGFIHTNPSDEATDGAFNRQVRGAGLQNLWGAEIHAVIRSHGPSNGKIKQISTIGGYCLNVAPAAPCYDPQAVPFSVPGG